MRSAVPLITAWARSAPPAGRSRTGGRPSSPARSRAGRGSHALRAMSPRLGSDGVDAAEDHVRRPPRVDVVLAMSATQGEGAEVDRCTWEQSAVSAADGGAERVDDVGSAMASSRTAVGAAVGHAIGAARSPLQPASCLNLLDQVDRSAAAGRHRMTWRWVTPLGEGGDALGDVGLGPHSVSTRAARRGRPPRPPSFLPSRLEVLDGGGSPLRSRCGAPRRCRSCGPWPPCRRCRARSAPGTVAHAFTSSPSPMARRPPAVIWRGTERRVALGHPRVEGTAPHVSSPSRELKSMGIQRSRSRR